MNIWLVYIVATWSLIGWILHLLFILWAVGNKGEITLDYNSHHEMNIEVVFIIFVLILNVIFYAQLISETIGGSLW